MPEFNIYIFLTICLSTIVSKLVMGFLDQKDEELKRKEKEDDRICRKCKHFEKCCSRDPGQKPYDVRPCWEV